MAEALYQAVFASALALAALVFIWKVLNWAYLRPKRLERALRKEGFKGNSYRLVYGDFKQIMQSVMEARSSSIRIDDDIKQRVASFIVDTIHTHVSRPVFAEDGSVVFDGKIGIWSFIEEYTAKRNSSKRPKGTVELKPIQSITKTVVKDCILKEILSAIKLKWPTSMSKRIQIQQDNCRTHINNTDPEFQEAANVDGFNIQLVQQPSNSPDCNANDLGLFTAIQSLQQRMKCKNPEDLIKAVQESFQIMEPQTLNKFFFFYHCSVY